MKITHKQSQLSRALAEFQKRSYRTSVKDTKSGRVIVVEDRVEYSPSSNTWIVYGLPTERRGLNQLLSYLESMQLHG